MNSIDTRVVQMQFENSQFERNIQESLRSLEKLDSDLQGLEKKSGLDHLRDVGNSFNLNHIAGSVDALTQSFSALGSMGRRVIENITDGLYNASVSFAKDLSVDNISAGWGKFEEKTKAVQAIMNSTGLSMEEVDKQLSMLQWYTDETSYSYSDMINNISKFTAMRVPLDVATRAMMGISNWAALSGRGTQEASVAMYNLSQAIGTGYLKLGDWMSIKNQMMGTPVFKETAIEVAKATGALDKMGRTAKGNVVNIETFDSTLADAWFNKDVLLGTLDKFSDYMVEVYKIHQQTGESTADIMERLSDSGMELGKKASKAAQEYIVFSDTIRAVKDAVSTGWMETFELVIGDYEHATEVWTALGDALLEVFAGGTEARNGLLRAWNELGGREILIQGVIDALEGLVGIVQLIKKAWSSVFPPKTVDDLMVMSNAVADFGKNLKDLYTIEKKLISRKEIEVTDPFEPIKEFNKQFKRGARGDDVKEMQSLLMELDYRLDKHGADGIYGPETQAALEAFKKDYGLTIDDLYDEATHAKLWEAVYEKRGPTTHIEYEEEYEEVLTDEAQGLVDGLTKIFGIVKGLFTGVSEESNKTLLPSLKEIIGMISRLIISFLMADGVTVSLTNIVKGIVAGFSILIKVVSFVIKVIGHLITIFMPVFRLIVHIGGAIGNLISSINAWLTKTNALDKAFEYIKKTLQPVANFIENATNAILDFFGLRPNSVVGDAISNVTGLLNLVGLGASDSGKKILTFKQLWDKFVNRLKSSEAIKKLSTSFQNLQNSINKVIPKIKKIWGTVKENLGTGFTNLLEQIPDAIANVIDWFAEFVSKGFDLVTSLVDKLPDAIQKVKDFWGTLTQEGDPASGKAPGFLIKVRDAFRSVIDFLFGEGDIANGKQAGIFKKLGQLLSGDMEAFTEGLDEDKKKEILDRIQSVKDFFQRVREFLVVLFGGELDEDKKLSDETINKLHGFHDSISAFFEGISFLFTGNVKEDSKLSVESIESLQGVRDFFQQIKEFFIVLFGGELDEDKKLSDETIARIQEFHSSVSSVFDSIGSFFVDVFNSISALITGTNDDGTVNQAHEMIVGIFNSIGEFFVNIFKEVRGLITGTNDDGTVNQAHETIVGIFNSIGEFFTGIYNSISSFITENINEETINQAVGFVVGIFDSIGAFFTNIYNSISGFITENINGDTINQAKEIVIGVFNSIGTFFTNIYNSISSFITENVNAETINQVVSFIVGIFDSIGKFFTGIYNSISGFITENINEGTIEQVKNFVIGIFSSIGEFFTNAFNFFKGLITGTNDDGTVNQAHATIAGIFSSIGEFFTSIYNSISGFITENINEGTIEQAKNFVIGIFDSIGEFFTNIFNAIGVLITGNGDPEKDAGILKFRETIISIINAIADMVVNIWNSIVSLFQNGISFESLGTFFTSIWESIKGFVEQVAGVVSTNYQSATDGVSTFFDNFWKNVKKWAIIGAIAYIVFKIVKLIGKITGVFDSAQKNTTSMADSILKLAISFGIIAGAIYLLGSVMTKGQLERGLAAFRWIAGTLLVFVLIAVGSGIYQAIAKAKDVSNSFESLGKYMLSIAAAIGIVALAVWLVGSKLTPEQADAGVNTILKVAGIIAALSLALKLISLIPGGSSNSFSGLWELAALVLVMGIVVFGLSKMSEDELTKGLTALLKMMGIIAGFLLVLGLANRLSKFGNVLDGLWQVALLVGVMALAVFGLSKMSEDELTKGLTALLKMMGIIAGFLLVIAGANRLSGLSSNAMKGLWQVALLVGVMALVVFGLSKMNEDELNRGMTAILEIMGILAGFILVVGFANGLSGSGEALKGLWQVALLVAVMAGAVYALAQLEDKVWTGVGAMAAIMVLIALLAGVMGHAGKSMKTGPMIAFFLGLAAVMLVFAISLSMIQNVPWGVIATFSIGMVLIAGAMAFLLPILGNMDLGVALKGCGILVLIFGALGLAVKIVLELIGSSLSSFSGALWLVGNDLKDFSDTMTSLDESTADKFKTFMEAVTSAFMNVTGIDYTAIDNFTAGLTRIGSGVMLFTMMTSGITEDTGSNFEKFAQSIINGCGKLSLLMFTADDINEALLQVGGAISIFYGDLQGATVDENGKVSTEVVQAAFDAIAELDIDETAIANVAQYSDGKGSGLNDFATGMANLSTAIGRYGEEIGKLNSTQVKTANEALECISSVAQTQTAIGIFDDFASLITGKRNHFTLFIDDVAALGVALGSYGTNIGTLNETQVKTANSILTTISGLDIEKTGGVFQWFEGEKNLDKFATNIKHIGDGLASYADSISGKTFTKTQMENSLIPITTLAEAQSKLPKTGGLMQLLGGSANLSTLGTNLVAYGKKLMEFSGEVEGFKKENIEDAMLTLERLVEVQKNYMDVDANSYEWAIANMAYEVNDAFTTLSDLNGDTNKINNANKAIGRVMTYLDQMSGKNEQLDKYDPNVYLGKIRELLNGLGIIANEIDDTMVIKYSELGMNLASYISNGLAGGDLTIGLGLLIAKALISLDKYENSFRISGGNFTVGLANGVAFNTYLAVKAATSVAQKMAQAVNNALGIRSPSRVAAEAGGYFTEGLAMGTTDKLGEATSAAEKVADSMLTSASGTLSTLSGLLADDIDVNPVIAPVVDLTQARESAALIGGLFGNPSVGVTSSVLAKDAMVSTNNGRPITIQNGTMSTTESLGSVTEQLNALTSYLTARNDGPHVSEMESLTEKFGDLAEAVTGLKIVLDTGTLVGELTPALDTGLGNYAAMRDRGN